MDFSVRWNFPDPGILDSTLIKPLLLSVVLEVLSDSDHQQWPARGWLSKIEFDRELDAALEQQASSMILARMQTRQEADTLVERLQSVQITAEVVNEGAPQLLSSVSPPPARSTIEGTDDPVSPEDQALPHSDKKVYSVLLHSPDEAPPVGCTERRAFINRWFTDQRPHIQHFLGKKYAPGVGGSTSGFTWPKRGWRSDDHFAKHCPIALQSNSTCAVARKQSYTESRLLMNRLRKLGLRTSLSSNEPAVVAEYGLEKFPDESEADRTWNGGDGGGDENEDDGDALSDATDEDDEPLSAEELARPHDESMKYCVLIHAPSDMPDIGSSVRKGKVKAWFQARRGRIQRNLGNEYRPGVGGSTSSFSWPQRGWAGSEHFAQHCPVVLETNSACVVARAQSFVEASLLMKRMERLGLRSSLSSTEQSIVSRYGLERHPDESAGNRVVASIPPGGMGNEEVSRMAQSLGLPSPEEMHRLVAERGGDAGTVIRDMLEGLEGGGGRLQNALRELFNKNQNSGTKKSVLDALPTKLYSRAESGLGECIMCMDDFAEKDAITTLPCGHTFHLGFREGDDQEERVEGGTLKPKAECCTGILEWLRSNHTCPVCRLELESTDVAWTCPLCNAGVKKKATCRCGCRQDVFRVAEGMVSNLFDDTEKLFLECLRFNRDDASGSENDGTLGRRIEQLLERDDMKGALERGWEIHEGIRNLLYSGLRGDEEICFHAGHCDTNSRGLLAILFNRVKERVNSSMPNRTTAPRFQQPGVQRHECPFCESDMTFSDSCSDCQIGRKTIDMGRNYDNKLFQVINDLFMRILEAHSTGSSDIATMGSLRAEFTKLLEGEIQSVLVSRGWELKECLSTLFEAAFRGERKLKYVTTLVMDRNSCGLFAILVNKFRGSIANSASAQQAGFELQKPVLSTGSMMECRTKKHFVNPNTRAFVQSNEQLFQAVARLIVRGGKEGEWDVLERQIFPSMEAGNWKLTEPLKLIRSGQRDLDLVTRGVDPNSAAVVELVLMSVVEMEKDLQSANENAATAGDVASSGRVAPTPPPGSNPSPLSVSVARAESAGSDVGACNDKMAAVALSPEKLRERQERLERKRSNVARSVSGGSSITESYCSNDTREEAEEDALGMDGGGLERQPSIGTQSKDELAVLREKHTNNNSLETLQKILKTLLEILENVRKEPSKEKFRRIPVKNQRIKRDITSHVEVLSILKRVGFQFSAEVQLDEEGKPLDTSTGNLEMEVVNLDKIIRMIAVVKEECESVTAWVMY